MANSYYDIQSQLAGYVNACGSVPPIPIYSPWVQPIRPQDNVAQEITIYPAAPGQEIVFNPASHAGTAIESRMKVHPGFYERIIDPVTQKELNFRFRNKGGVDLVIAAKEEWLSDREKSEIVGPEGAINKRLVEGEELWVMTLKGFEAGYYEIAFSSRPQESMKWPRMAGTEPEVKPGERAKRKEMGG